jgi:eukaryotic-like serine/threonine-protein kinase
MDLTGAQFGVLEVWGSISEGGMSRVWLARHRELSIPVVVKTLLEECAGEHDFERLRNEARLTARIPSHRVVHAVDVGVHAGHPYLAQEYIDGLDLAELDKRRRETLGRGLPLWFVCRVAHQVAEALHAAHQTGVLHRDVKPSNLFGSPQTGVCLGDFGIAVARGIRQTEQYGTLRFVAPETLRGDQPSRRCDLYSLGATVFDLYYGSPPHTRIADIVRGAPLPFPAPRSAEEAAFQHILRCMLEFDPERRTPSAKVALRQFGKMARALAPAISVAQLGRGQYQLGSVLVTCTQGDIADVQADGIVNSANDDMRMRTGVGGCLRARGGQVVEDEALAGGRRALGQCIATSGGALACRRVLHAVAAWKEASCIARASQRALLLAEELGLKTLAIPALGTGVARVAPEACAYAVASALHQHVVLGGTRLREVRFVLYDKDTLELFIEELNGVFLGEADFVEQTARPRSDPALEETLHLESVRTQSAPPESM